MLELRELRTALLQEAAVEAETSLRVWVAIAAGVSRAEIAEQLELTSAEISACLKRARRVAQRMG